MNELVPAIRHTKTSKRSREKRTASINSAYNRLRSHIPNIPAETKLSKIKTLRYAASSIKYLTDMLQNEATEPVELSLPTIYHSGIKK
ncbi:Oidioi.mRNA.OKI2018_I69.XSR.g14077.t1.cds [Oikopleura dioica]|uniref:Oidioi.mRNA.OKI2018_I69.XSR.g14077.t1.cds n=1 Tax=Oikopleura dioica TaxID=34765 RepID=A0ABN7SAJ3_OIKDI|nr:Oidioi.mRNA.OKI2018_I69.XSR.g14077.t1.cds [Oikopleura dioica]